MMADREPEASMARVLDDRIVGTRVSPMTYEEWLDRSDGDSLSEWADGEGFFYLSNSDRHQAVLGFLHILLTLAASRLNLGVVRLARSELKLERAARQPDLLFLATEHLTRLTPMRLLGPADLVVELISEESVRRDRVTKRREYEEVGIPEYWLIDVRPGGEETLFLHLDPEGVYRPMPLDADGIFRSRALPGFWLDGSWLHRDPLPDPDLLLDRIAPRPR